MVVNDIVERTICFLAKAELDSSLTQTVHAAVESERRILIRETAIDTSCHVHKRRIHKVDSLGFLEVVFSAVKRE